MINAVLNYLMNAVCNPESLSRTVANVIIVSRHLIGI